MEDMIISIAICVVLPVSIVFIVFLASVNSDNQRAKILIKAIEANNSLDADKLAQSLQKPKKTALEILNLRLLRGCVSVFLGIAAAVYAIFAKYSGAQYWDLSVLSFLLCCAFLAIGAGYLVVYFVTRKQVLGSKDED